VPVDIRIIATSNRNLAGRRARRHLPRDLLFPAQRCELEDSAVRERPADILELAQHFAKKYADANACRCGRFRPMHGGC